MPYLDRTTRYLVDKFQLIGGLNLIDILIVIAKDVLLWGSAAQKKEHWIHK